MSRPPVRDSDRPRRRPSRPVPGGRAGDSGKTQSRRPAAAAATPTRKPASTRAEAAAAPTKPERIAKLLARAGVASRREVERMIADGRIALAGQTVTTPATLLCDVRDVTLDGKPVAAPEPMRLWRFHKPPKCLTTTHDPKGRTTIFDLLPPDLPRLVTIGRLDYNTEGLLLLTTSGALARWMELPATGLERTYRVRARGRVSVRALDALMDGITIDGMRYGPINAQLDRTSGGHVWLSMRLREGKNREVRTVCTHLGLEVARLIRVDYGPLELGELPPCGLEEVPRATLRRLLPQAPVDDAHHRR